MAKIAWEQAANWVDKIYDTYVNLDREDEDRCFICPECGEPILEEDFPELDSYAEFYEEGELLFYCPVCETEI